uniref:Uncharacterized protein LOC8267269 isoform X1 n=1 Tax=Rhizophora mucronata TaxID=61149 RepID=A0A2P2KH57_RHIMU
MTRHDSKLPRLRRMIDDCIRPYTISSLQTDSSTDLRLPFSLTGENENDLLIALSQVLREIHLWISGIDCNSVAEQETEAEPVCDQILVEIFSDLILPLSAESPYVQHLSSNVLVAISEFVVASGSEWESFVHTLCACLELVLAHVLTYSRDPLMNAVEETNCDLQMLNVLKPRMKYANWFTAAGIIRVFRHILKNLNQGNDDQLLEALLGSISSFLLPISRDFKDKIGDGQSNDTLKSQVTNASFLKSVGEEDPKVQFLGSFIQFLCSLVEQSSLFEDKLNTQYHHPVVDLAVSFVPELLHGCLGKQGNCLKVSTSHYFRHKILMLMLRLSYQACLSCSIFVSWLQLLHDYFEEHLLKPLKLKTLEDECLEDSPFSWTLCAVEGGDLCSPHLQRQAILLFLRCCLSLINWERETNKQFACATLDSCLSFDSVLESDCCCRKKGFLELFKWLRGHLPANISVDNKLYMEKCMGFTISFLRLYMHEDDLLFKVLLQLVNVPSHPKEQLYEEKWTFHDLQGCVPFHASDVFNPIYLFHLFLAELHYDHQVLLDYLISKDIGISCAEYLLRCLRIVYNSWNSFVKFCVVGEQINQSSSKKIKFLLDGSDFQAEPPSPSVRDIMSSLEEKHKSGFDYDCMWYETKMHPFKEAKTCLFYLKDSLENLHKRSLFPYNPEVLLKWYAFLYFIPCFC